MIQNDCNKLRILYVEDEYDAREQTMMLLQEHFDTVFSAANGKEGLETYEKEPCDLVITDIKMPIMDGVEMVQSIRQINPAQPVMVVSAYDFSDKLRPFLEREVEFFLAKPYHPENLLKAIRDICEEHKAVNGNSGEMDSEATITALRRRVADLEKELMLMEQKLRDHGIDY